MPIFDYRCPSCKHEDFDVFVSKYDEIVRCLQCGSEMSKLLTMSKQAKFADVFPAEGVFLKHVSPEGKTFFSKKEMRSYEREHNVELGYLL